MKLIILLSLLGLAQTARANEQETPRPHQAVKAVAAERFPINLTPEARAELNRQARMQLARVAAAEGDILTWGQALFPDKFPLPFCRELHDYFVTIRGDEFTNTEAPRGHAKTTIKCFLIPIYQALVEPKSFRHYLNVQATSTKSDAVNMAIKLELEENRELRELYGDQVTKNRWTNSQFVLANGVVFSSIGAGQSIRGINYRNIRPDYVLIDDLYDEEDINNVEATEKKNDWFWGSLYKARAVGRRTSMHVQGTAINTHDLMEVLKTKKRWLSKTFKGVKDAAKEEILWKELGDADRASLFADFEDMPTVIFNREVQNERRDDSESIVKKAWLKGWVVSEESFLEDREIVRAEAGCDPSVGATLLADYTGIVNVVVARQKDQPVGVCDYLLVAAENAHLSLNKRVEAVQRVASSGGHNASLVHIEAIAAFADFAGEVKRKTNLRVRDVKQVKDKITNLENKSGYFENGRVFVSSDMNPKLVATLEHQLTTNFPKNDDLRDALLLVLPDLKRKQSWRPIA